MASEQSLSNLSGKRLLFHALFLFNRLRHSLRTRRGQVVITHRCSEHHDCLTARAMPPVGSFLMIPSRRDGSDRGSVGGATAFWFIAPAVRSVWPVSASQIMGPPSGSQPLLVCGALVLIYGCYALRSVRWQVSSATLAALILENLFEHRSRVLRRFIYWVVPASRSGQFCWARRAKLPMADIFGIWVLERAF